MQKLLVIALVLFSSVCCKNSKQSTQSNLTTVTTAQTVQPEIEKELPDSMYRVIVSFISIGEGIDLSAVEQLDEIAATHQRDFGMPLAKEEYRWGREGEVDYCFKMKNEGRKAKDSFVRSIREKFSGNKLIQIEENAICRHKR